MREPGFEVTYRDADAPGAEVERQDRPGPGERREGRGERSIQTLAWRRTEDKV